MHTTLGAEAEIFAHVMYNHYSAPPSFDFDKYGDGKALITDKSDHRFNADERIEQFANYIMEMAQHYRSKNLFVAMGDDFKFQDA